MIGGVKRYAKENRACIAEAFAGMVDSLMVSSIGVYAVAAVGLTTQPKFLALAMFIALNVSVSAIVARRRGQKDRYGANQISRFTLTTWRFKSGVWTKVTI